MELDVAISGAVLLVIALASVAGGLILYRGSRRVGWRAVGMSSVALGVGVLLVFTLTLPGGKEDEAPDPVIVAVLGQTQSPGASATRQRPEAPVTLAPPDGPLDTAWAEVTMLSTQEDLTGVRIEEITAYRRERDATYPKLEAGDEILVRVYDRAALVATRGTSDPATAVRVGDVPSGTSQPVLAEGQRYMAKMSVCFADHLGGLGCAYEGWSVAIYPLGQSYPSITPRNGSG